jgi:Ca2+-binding RTX toxin-like protein
MSVVITATSAGFHLLTASGHPFAPSLFLRDALNGAGRVNLTLDTGIWVSPLAGEAGLMMALETDQVLTTAQDGTQTEIIFTTATLYRWENGEQVAIATIDFGTGLAVIAQADEINGTTGWHVDIADAFAEKIKTEGLIFEGGAGLDLFEPEDEPIYYTLPNRINLGGGDDTATGTTGDDHISGCGGDDVILDDLGVNSLGGGKGNDTITVGDGSDGSILRGGAGDDWLYSGNGADVMNGGHDDDMIFGGGGDDRLRGGNGVDYLNGGAGSDLMTGGAGADMFDFIPASDGHDIITDFQIGTDHIRLGHGAMNFDDLILTQQGRKVVITIEDADFSITLRHTSVDDLTADDFIFA